MTPRSRMRGALASIEKLSLELGVAASATRDRVVPDDSYPGSADLATNAGMVKHLKDIWVELSECLDELTEAAHDQQALKGRRK